MALLPASERVGDQRETMANITVKKGLIGQEDINLGTGTFSRAKSDGSAQTITKVNAEQLITLPAGTRTVSTVTDYLANAAVHNVKDYGAVGDGSTDDVAAFLLAVTACIADNGTLYIPAGTYLYSALPIDITDSMSVVGDGRRSSILRPTSSYTGFAVRVNECWRNSGEGQAIAAYDGSASKAGVQLRDFAIIGTRATGTENGIQTYGRCDHLTVTNVSCAYLKGVGLEIGASGATTNTLCRESTFINVDVDSCGDTASTPAVHITTGLTSGDGTNQLDFIGCKFRVNYGPVLIDNAITAASGNDTRRICFTNLMLHGRNTESDAPAADVMQIVGRVNGVQFHGVRANGSHDVSSTLYAVLRIEDDSTNNNDPARIDIYGWECRNCDGDGIVVDDVDGLSVRGSVQQSTIAGNEITIATAAVTGHVLYDVSGPDNNRTISIGAGAVNRVYLPNIFNTSTTTNLADTSHVVNDDEGGRYKGKTIFATDDNTNYTWNGTVWRCDMASRNGQTFTWNPGSLVDGAGETKSVAVTGAALGDFVVVSAPYDLQDMTATAYVQATDTVEVRLQNESTATVDLASGTWEVQVFHTDSITPA